MKYMWLIIGLCGGLALLFNPLPIKAQNSGTGTTSVSGGFSDPMNPPQSGKEGVERKPVKPAIKEPVAPPPPVKKVQIPDRDPKLRASAETRLTQEKKVADETKAKELRKKPPKKKVKPKTPEQVKQEKIEDAIDNKTTDTDKQEMYKNMDPNLQDLMIKE